MKKRKVKRRKVIPTPAKDSYYYERIDPATLSAKQNKSTKKKAKKSEGVEDWEKEWKDMPEFVQENLAPWLSLKVHFKDFKGLAAFSKLVKQKITKKTKFIWYPEALKAKYSDKEYADES